MTKTYQQLIKQIAALKLEADKLRKGEVDEVIARIRDAIKVYELTAADLGLGSVPKANAGKAAAPIKRRKVGKGAAKAKGTVKFSNGAGGTWGGIGKRPNWLREAVAAGKQVSDFAVK